MTTEQLLLLAIDKHISPMEVFGNEYTAYQLADMISLISQKGLVAFSDDFEISLTVTGREVLCGTKRYISFFPRRQFISKKVEKEYKIYFPKRQNLL